MQLEHVLEYLPIGVALLDGADLRIRYINPYMHSLLEEPWGTQDVIGRSVEEVVPDAIYKDALPLLQHVARTGQRIHRSDVPYEGFLETRGRTYWQVSLELAPAHTLLAADDVLSQEGHVLLITVKDVTNEVRYRLHLKAINHISAAIVGAFSLPHVLDRILQAVQEMVGSTRCAILLVDHSMVGSETHAMGLGYEEAKRVVTGIPRTATIAAQKGVHLLSQNWHPAVSEQLLLGRAIRGGYTLVITDTSSIPDVELPWLDDNGEPRRPGSVLCVPIFEGLIADDSPATPANGKRALNRPETVLGTIEVYHRRTRGFPPGEVELLEQFAQQAGLAIQNARLFRSVDRLARAASRSAHQRENVMQAMPDGVIIYDPRWRIAETNHAVRRLLGWSNDVIGLGANRAMARSNATFYDNRVRFPRSVAEYERRALVGQIDEFKMVGADGQHYTMRCSYTPIRDAEGDLFAFVVIYHDVTEQAAARERIEAEVIERTRELAQRNEALQQAQASQEFERQRLSLLLERLPSGVLLISAADNTVTVVNRRAVQLLQSVGAALEPLDDPDEAARRAVGSSYQQLIAALSLYGPSGSLLPYEETPLYRALSVGEASEAELHVTATDGQILYLLANAAPLRALDGTITDAVLVLHEITRVKTLERAREDFFTTMAHELKTPLANIRAHLSALLARDLVLSTEEQRAYLQTADGQVERLVDMINHFLDASRVEAGALRLELEPILLPEMLEDLQDRLEALIASSHRQLRITIPPQLPAVLADYELIMSVLTNLLSNAFRYAPEHDTVLLEVEPVFEGDDAQPSSVTLRVIDRGPGLTQEQQKVLFTRFSTFAAMRRPDVDRPGQPMIERRRGAASWSPATGLGLYISQGIIEAHGSTLTLRSSPGQGAAFAFTLPTVQGKS